MASFLYPLEHKDFTVEVGEDLELTLWVDGCLRKADRSSDPVLYVWTNIELHWEEHRFVEVLFERATKELRVSINRKEVDRRQLT